MINKDDSKAKRTIPTVLDAFRKFLRPSISGNAMYKGFVFAETTDLLDRLVLMESSEVQLMVIYIAASLAKYHPNSVDALTNGTYVSAREVTDHAIGFSTATIRLPRMTTSQMV